MGDNAGSGDDHRSTRANPVGDDRDRNAEGRDQRAEAHDHESEARDERADARDKRAETRERAAGEIDAGAVADRAGALRDRRGGASDRTQSADDRVAASADRVASAGDRGAASIDGLTRAYRREAGIVELRREVARARRMKQPLSLAFVDIDSLKQTNDALGHAAGDQVLRETAELIRTYFRTYDLTVRYGGDEFLCALFGMEPADAEERFSRLNAQLKSTRQASVTFGLAALREDDDLEDLVARADAAMYEARQQRRSTDV